MDWSEKTEGRESHFPIPEAPVKYKGHIPKRELRASSWGRGWLPMEGCGFRVGEWSSIPSLVADSTFAPSVGLCFLFCGMQKDVLSTCFYGRKKRLKEKEFISDSFKQRGEAWADAKPRMYEDTGARFDTPCPWHQKSMERTLVLNNINKCCPRESGFWEYEQGIMTKIPGLQVPLKESWGSWGGESPHPEFVLKT